ncbi:hypothetical protein, partial [Helicobacter sp. 12S02232-10]|uniref:hypothetical protein n=1 Tax=Helicobacter sp. 12S02232-10 TaxID=1476197 RepID=UPI0015DD9B31
NNFFGGKANSGGMHMVFAKASDDKKGLETILKEKDSSTNLSLTDSKIAALNKPTIPTDATSEALTKDATNTQEIVPTYGQNAWVASSSYSLGTLASTDALNLTFIGDAALGTYNKTLSANEVTSIVSSNASSVYNFINAGTLSNKADS